MQLPRQTLNKFQLIITAVLILGLFQVKSHVQPQTIVQNVWSQRVIWRRLTHYDGIVLIEGGRDDIHELASIWACDVQIFALGKWRNGKHHRGPLCRSMLTVRPIFALLANTPLSFRILLKFAFESKRHVGQGLANNVANNACISETLNYFPVVENFESFIKLLQKTLLGQRLKWN